MQTQIDPHYAKLNKCYTFIVLLFYTGDQFDGYDFAILVLEKEVSFNSMAKVIKLPEEDIPCPQNKSLMALGWGTAWRKGREIDPYLPIVLRATRSMCLDPTTHCPKFDQNGNTLCVGDPKTPSNSPCTGDAGGTKGYYQTT